jgi:hypothetical protein
MIGSLRTGAIFVGVVLMAAAAALPAEGAGDATTTTEKTCFRVRDTRGMSAIDDRHVAVECVRDRFYLLTMANTCFGLENSIAVKVASEFDRVCSNDRAWLTYRDFDQTKRCEILTVESVADLEEAKILVEKRKQSGERQPAEEAKSEAD